jgi:hypothetical protein
MIDFLSLNVTVDWSSLNLLTSLLAGYIFPPISCSFLLLFMAKVEAVTDFGLLIQDGTGFV